MKIPAYAGLVFQEKTVPEETRLAGWALLAHALSIASPVRRPSSVSQQHVRGSFREEGGWKVFDRRYWPGTTLAGHLAFALRHEDLDLLTLKRIFDAVPRREVQAMVRAAPSGIPARRAWYLYELLTNHT